MLKSPACGPIPSLDETARQILAVRYGYVNATGTQHERIVTEQRHKERKAYADHFNLALTAHRHQFVEKKRHEAPNVTRRRGEEWQRCDCPFPSTSRAASIR